jgi:hypothetical protein
MTAAYFEDHPTDPEKVILRKPPLDQGADYERGFVDGMQYQMQSSVDKAVNRMAQTQEPFAWMDADGNVSDNNDHKCFPIPLYTAPPQRTEQELVGTVKELFTNSAWDRLNVRGSTKVYLEKDNT